MSTRREKSSMKQVLRWCKSFPDHNHAITYRANHRSMMIGYLTENDEIFVGWRNDEIECDLFQHCPGCMIEEYAAEHPRLLYNELLVAIKEMNDMWSKDGARNE